MGKLADLPKDFDPEKYWRDPVSGIRPGSLDEGVNLIHHDVDEESYLLAKVELAPQAEGAVRAARGRTIRCWRCYRRPDGSYDCFQVSCPWDASIVMGRFVSD